MRRLEEEPRSIIEIVREWKRFIVPKSLYIETSVRIDLASALSTLSRDEQEKIIKSSIQAKLSSFLQHDVEIVEIYWKDLYGTVIPVMTREGRPRFYPSVLFHFEEIFDFIEASLRKVSDDREESFKKTVTASIKSIVDIHRPLTVPDQNHFPEAKNLVNLTVLVPPIIKGQVTIACTEEMKSNLHAMINDPEFEMLLNGLDTIPDFRRDCIRQGDNYLMVPDDVKKKHHYQVKSALECIFHWLILYNIVSSIGGDGGTIVIKARASTSKVSAINLFFQCSLKKSQFT